MSIDGPSEYSVSVFDCIHVQASRKQPWVCYYGDRGGTRSGGHLFRWLMGFGAVRFRSYFHCEDRVFLHEGVMLRCQDRTNILDSLRR